MQNLLKTYKTNLQCPRCGKPLETSDIREYAFVCKDCDENFYSCELEQPDQFQIIVPMSKNSFETAAFRDGYKTFNDLSKRYRCTRSYNQTTQTIEFTWDIKDFDLADETNEMQWSALAINCFVIDLTMTFAMLFTINRYDAILTQVHNELVRIRGYRANGGYSDNYDLEQKLLHVQRMIDRMDLI